MNSRPVTLLTDSEIKKLADSGKSCPVQLTAEELSPLTGLEEFIACSFSLSGNFKDDKLPPTVHMTVALECTIIDNVTFKKEREIFADTDNVNFFGDHDDDVVERDGNYYDLRPAFLAILYSLVPLSYSKEKKFQPRNVNGFAVMSEEEYRSKKTRQDGKNSPFAQLDEDDFSEE